MFKIDGVVSRTYSGGKVGTVTLEVPGSGRYPERLTFKSFDSGVIGQIAKLGQGESIGLDFKLQTEKVMHAGVQLEEAGKDGKTYPVKVPLLVITGITVQGATGESKPIDNSNIPF